MTYKELISKVRNILDDIVQPLLWTDEELFSYAVKATNAVRMETGVGASWYNYLTIADMDNISLDTSLYEVFVVLVDGYPSHRLESYDIFLTYPPAKGRPYCHAYYEKKLYLYPTPDEVYPVRVLASSFVTPLATDEIPLPKEYQEFLIEGILADAYSKNDLETVNLQKAERYRLLFRERLEQIKNLQRRIEISLRPFFYPRGLF